MIPDALVSGGGIAGLLAVIGMLGKLALDAWRESHTAERDDQAGHREDRTSSVTDASTANAIILSTLKEVHRENEALRSEVQSLRDEVASKDSKIVELSESLQRAQSEITRIAEELAKLTSVRDA